MVSHRAPLSTSPERNYKAARPISPRSPHEQQASLMERINALDLFMQPPTESNTLHPRECAPQTESEQLNVLSDRMTNLERRLDQVSEDPCRHLAERVETLEVSALADATRLTDVQQRSESVEARLQCVEDEMISKVESAGDVAT